MNTLDQPGWLQSFHRHGFIKLGPCYQTETLLGWNEKLDQHFNKSEQERSYATIKDLDDLGILSDIFNEKLRSLMMTIMPDPVLLCCHVYETKPSDKPHIFSDTFSGWHRDVNELPGLNANDPNYVSFFVHLSHVSKDSGAFEIIPESFTGPLQNKMDSILATGEIGTNYMWNRTMFHRASPNKSTLPRRILKISFQHNYLQNEFILSEHFKILLNKYEQEDNTFLSFMLGAKHKEAPVACLPDPFASSDSSFTPFTTNSKTKITFFNWIRSILWYLKRGKKMFGP